MIKGFYLGGKYNIDFHYYLVNTVLFKLKLGMRDGPPRLIGSGHPGGMSPPLPSLPRPPLALPGPSSPSLSHFNSLRYPHRFDSDLRNPNEDYLYKYKYDTRSRFKIT